ncbi:MAG: UvrD-helicase domain-containing protein, partial [Pseudomonadota bacterium]
MNEATRAQIAAADPARSTWVSANAGSGKTSVLTDRVVRLLLGGTAPGRILCLTYTKAAAAEMQNRLFKRLGAWAMMPDRDLEAALAALGAVDPGAVDARFLAQARRLFANALETPGGLKIQTIHAFCDTLLRRFPVEAGVSPQFEVLDDREAALMRGVILNTMAEEERELFDDLAFFVTGDADTLLAEIATKRDVLSIAAVEQAFGADETLDPRQELKKVLGPLALSDVVAAAQEGLADTPSNTMEIACKQLLTVAGERDPQNVIDGLAQVFLTQSGQARKSLPIAKKSLLQRLPGVFEPLEAMAHRLV